MCGQETMQLRTVCDKYTITPGSFEAKISIDIQQTWYFSTTLYVFLKRHSKNVKSHVFFWNLKKRKIRILEHRLAGTDPVSLRSCSVQQARGRPGRLLQSPPSERPDARPYRESIYARPTWQCRALCAGVPWASRAMWPNQLTSDVFWSWSP